MVLLVVPLPSPLVLLCSSLLGHTNSHVDCTNRWLFVGPISPLRAAGSHGLHANFPSTTYLNSIGPGGSAMLRIQSRPGTRVRGSGVPQLLKEPVMATARPGRCAGHRKQVTMESADGAAVGGGCGGVAAE